MSLVVETENNWPDDRIDLGLQQITNYTQVKDLNENEGKSLFGLISKCVIKTEFSNQVPKPQKYFGKMYLFFPLWMLLL